MAFDFRTMTDTELLERLRDTHGLVQYYESAEGEWGRETTARLYAKARLELLSGEAVKRGFDLLQVLQ